MTVSRVDVAIAGDGPAAGALCRACVALGLEVVVVGRGDPWTNKYGTWIDDLSTCMSPADVDATIPVGRERVRVVGDREHIIDREYGVFDNARLRAWTGIDAHHDVGDIVGFVQHPDHAVIKCGDGRDIAARWVVDATGPPVDARPVAWQTAYGVFVDDGEMKRLRGVLGIADGAPTTTLMDWSPLPSALDVGAPTFCYIVNVGSAGDGAARWLLEETVLASSRLIEPEALRSRLAARIGDDVVDSADSRGDIDRVTIPMGLPVRRGEGRIAVFGTAAGMGHPATGYSVAAALRAAPAMATALANTPTAADTNRVHPSVWVPSARKVRALHDYGLAVMLTLDDHDTRRFFDAFFDLPVEVWAPYMRNDASVRMVTRAMTDLFVRLPWSMRRRLVAAAPSFSLKQVRRVGARLKPTAPAAGS